MCSEFQLVLKLRMVRLGFAGTVNGRSPIVGLAMSKGSLRVIRNNPLPQGVSRLLQRNP